MYNFTVLYLGGQVGRVEENKIEKNIFVLS